MNENKIQENANKDINLQENNTQQRVQEHELQQRTIQEGEIRQGKEANKNMIKKDQTNKKVRRIIYYVLGVLEVLFAFRFIFKVLGANPQSPFVDFLYSLTNLFIAPFAGIFRTAKTTGIETQAVLEPSLIIAMIVYAAIAWGIVKLIEISTNRKESETL
jgi:cation transport ATPase